MALQAVVGLDLDEGDRGSSGVERMDDLTALGGREQPVRGEGDEAEPCPRVAEGRAERAAIIGREVEIIHRPGDVEIGVGVEAIDEG